VALIQGIPGEFEPQPWGEAILRSRELLLLRIARRPADHEVRLPGLATTPLHVVEDRTGKALTWRHDGDDLIVRLPDSGEPPLVRVALQGKLRIVPPDTVTANADGVCDVTPAGTTAHLVARRSADVAVRFFGPMDPDAQQHIRLAGRRYVVSGHQLLRSTIGPFRMPARRVLPLIAPTGVRRMLVAPVGTVLASIHPGTSGELTVLVTNFGRARARGEVVLPVPPGWSATDHEWMFDALDPGRSIGWATRLTGPPGAQELRVRIEAGRRSASSPYVIHL
jgi:hypothetical protein